jgi:hypothetical protein
LAAAGRGEAALKDVLAQHMLTLPEQFLRVVAQNQVYIG